MSPEFLADTNHASRSCTDCHGGDPTGATRKLAHVGMVKDPTMTDAEKACGDCHGATVAANAKSLHTTNAGFRRSMQVRNGGAVTEGHETALKNHCGRCHGSCGQCHVSTPTSAGGGLVAGHRFKRKAPMNLTCVACHGSRVGDEYKGMNAGQPADVHYNQGMQCTGCHTGAEMHGVGQENATHRYQASGTPACENCHPDDAAFQAVAAHAMHRDDLGVQELSCQVCHAVPYKNCYSCHVTLTDTGAPVYEVNAPTHESVMSFKIGLNPMRDSLHPAKWVTVRHAPAAPDNFVQYGDNLMGTFDLEPTWHLATPHNIQRVTPQNASCKACHKQRALFLGPDDLLDYEVLANQSVMVETPPGP